MYSRWACLLIAGACVYAADSNPDPRTHEAEHLIQKGSFLDAAQMLRDVYESAKKAASKMRTWPMPPPIWAERTFFSIATRMPSRC